MSDANHTPGPWVVYDENDNPWVGLSDFRSELVADTCGDFADHSGRTLAEKVANARLIAAAPDLLSAAEEMYRALDVDPVSSEGLRRLETWAAAIAKAKGG